MPKSFNKGVYWSEGDTVKDTNPRCTHYGSVGKVVKIGKGRTTFIVTNDGDTYKKGDKLTKTNNQLEKQAIAVSTAIGIGTVAAMGIGKAVKGIGKMMKGRGAAMHASKAKQLQAIGKRQMMLPKTAEDNAIKVDPKYLNIKALPSGKPMIVHSPMDSVMYKVLSDTAKAKQNQAVLDSIRSGKLDPKEYNKRVAKKRMKKEGEVNMFNFTDQEKTAFIGAATNRVMSLKKMQKAQKAMQGVTMPAGEKSKTLAQQILAAKQKGDKLQVQKLQQQFTKQAGMQKMKAFVDMGESVENAARKAYPDAPESAISDYVQKFKMNKEGKKSKKMYVDKVVMKSANLIQKAASKLSFDKIANMSLGYRGMLPGGTRKMPGQVGAVQPNTMGARGTHTGSY